MICYKDMTFCLRKGCPLRSCPRHLSHVDWSYGLPVSLADFWGRWGLCPPTAPCKIALKGDVTDDNETCMEVLPHD